MSTSEERSNPKSILVTGGAGYLGGTLLRAIPDFQGLDLETVRILDNFSNAVPQAVMDLPDGPQYELIEGDILDPTAVERALRDVDAVVHLAAVVSTPFSFAQPDNITQVNQWGTVRLVEQCLEANVERFILASSASVYGPGGPYSEEESCKPVGPYSHTKRQAEQAVLGRAGEGLEPTVLRLGTVYGGPLPCIRFEAFLNRFAYQAGTGQTLVVYGTGEQTRPVLHAEDAAGAILQTLTEAESRGEVYNVADRNLPIGEAAKTVSDLTDVSVRYTEQDYRDHITLAVETEKVEDLGWSAERSVQDGIGELVDHLSSIHSAEQETVGATDDVGRRLS